MENPSTSVEVTPFERLKDICASVDLDTEKIKPSILERMRLLAETTETVKDCERATELAGQVFSRYTDSPRSFSEAERRTVVIGSLFADIGKSGPGDAELNGQQLIAEMFAVEHVDDPQISVRDFFAQYFPADSNERISRFETLGLDPGMTMREFWNLHSLWTLQIIQGDGVPQEAVAAAATHHLLENVNPDSIVAEDGKFTKYFGENSSFDRAEKLVILLDKYDASRRRGGRSHEESIIWLKKLIAGHPRFHDDPQFLELIDVLDEVCDQKKALAA